MNNFLAPIDVFNTTATFSYQDQLVMISNKFQVIFFLIDM